MSRALAEPDAAASASPPLVPFDLASAVERLGEAWPRTLVPEADRAAIVAFVRPLPAVFHWVMLETRLSGASRRIDLLAAIIDPDPALRRRLAEPLPGAPLVRAWGAGRDADLGQARVLWLEWDDPYMRPPLQIAALDPRFWSPGDAMTPSPAQQVALHDAIHRASFGAPADPRVLGRLRAALEALPAGATALFAASLRPRGSELTRLFVALPRERAPAWLARVAWPGDPALARAWLVRAVAPWEDAYLQIEIGPEGLSPYLAIESCQTSGRRSERRMRAAFLGGLVAEGVVDAARARAVLDWEGTRRVGAFDEMRSFHLKCVPRDGEVEVKAYLGAHYRRARRPS